jgi:2-(1,2-epoxy-1,2-dihydrophenyl)acetyl-CoA isomerase
MSFETIELDVSDGIMTLALNRPASLNSFNVRMHREVRDALTQAEQEGVRCLLLTGRGRGFCTGQDLSDPTVLPGENAPDLAAAINDYYNPLIRRLRGLPFPVVCAINGIAAGAGANIALACDIVLAARSAAFVQAFSKIGLLPDSGGTWFLPRLIGPARAMALAMLGGKLPAEQAADWGLIWKVVDDEALEQEAFGLARHLATQPTQALAYIKQALNASWNNDLDRQLDLERDLQQAAGRTDDYREGVTAFMEKRTPAFRGR